MPDQALSRVLTKLYSIGLKARMLAVWVKTHRPAHDKHSMREIFTMELIQGFPPITRKDLCVIFALSPSSVSDVVRGLIEEGLVTEEKVAEGGDAREKPLAMTEKGTEYLAEMRRRESVRYKYLFETVSPEEWKNLAGLLDKIDAAARKQVDEMIFGK